MATGTTPFQYPDRHQPPNQVNIQPGNHYYQFRLHNARAIFNAAWPVGIDCILLVTEVSSSLYPDTISRSLHSVKTAKRNHPCNMGLRINLTDWLPARATDSCKITIKYIGVQAAPIKDLLFQMEESGLAAVVSTIEPTWKVALKVSDIVGKIVSHLIKEGHSKELFSVTEAFNLDGNLKTGYYAALGSTDEATIPSQLLIDSQQQLFYAHNGKPVKHLSQAILHLCAIPRMGEDIVRHELWWKLLQIAKDEIRHEQDLHPDMTPQKVTALRQKWGETLAQVKKLTREDKSYLQQEVDGIFATLSNEVLRTLQPERTLQSFSEVTNLPTSWQAALGISTTQELQERADDYKSELNWSRSQRQEYS